MFFWAVAIATAASVSADDLFSLYEKSAVESSLKAHADLAFKTAGSVSTLDSTTNYKNGFAYANFYGAAGCGGPILASTGKPTNQCILQYSDYNNANPTGSYMVTCKNGVQYNTQYTDTTCTNAQITIQHTLTCHALENAEYQSTFGYCNEDPSVIPLPNGDFTTEITYGSPTECSSDVPINEYSAYVNDRCYNSSGSSTSYNYPTKKTYTTGDCTGTATSTTLPSTCTPVTTYPVTGDDNLAYKWAPSTAPILTGAAYPSGFAYFNLYGSSNCAGPVVAAAGHPTNKCIVTYSDYDSATPTGSVLYTCDAGTMYTTPYTDLACTNVGLPYTQSFTCSNAAGRYASAQGYCNKDPSVIPVPGVNFTTEINYASPDDCSTGVPIDNFKSYLNDVCFSPSDGVANKYHFPTQTTYAANNCSGVATVTQLSEACTPVASYPVGEQNHLAAKWSDQQVISTNNTFDNGYVYFNLYQSQGCANEVVGVEGSPTNVCLLLYGNGSTPTGSHMWSCDNVNGYEAIFTDLECKVPAATPSNTVSNTCQNLNGGRFGSRKGMCNADPDNLPLPNGNFVTQVLFNQPNTCTTKAEFTSFLNQQCIRNSGTKSFSFDYPKVTFYSDATCNTVDTSETVPTTCVAVAKYPADNQVAAQYFYGFVPGSHAPTSAPTAAPTQAIYTEGFVYTNFRADRTCAGPILGVTGNPTNVCLQVYGTDSATATGSLKYGCAGDLAHTYHFSDANCEVPTTQSSQALGCHALLGPFGSREDVCTSDAGRLPLPASNFTTEIQYSSPTDCGGDIWSFESFEDGHCYTNLGANAVEYDFPTINHYTGNTCTGPVTSTQTVWTTCAAVTAYPTTLNRATEWYYGDVKLGSSSSSSDDLSTAAIAGIAAGGAVVVVAAAAGAYFFLASGAGGATAAATSGAGASAVNPMTSAV